MSKAEILIANYHNNQHADDITRLLEHYALDPMGGGKPLSAAVKESLVEHLANFPGAFSILAYIDGTAAGLINCFRGFSTFKCKPLINIHDVVVHSQFRGNGLASQMLQKVERVAKQQGCCKLTLEVLDNNLPAKTSYQHFGFDSYQLDQEKGVALFWEKPL